MASPDNFRLLLASVQDDPDYRALLRARPRAALRGRGLTRKQVQLLLRAAALETDHDLQRRDLVAAPS